MKEEREMEMDDEGEVRTHTERRKDRSLRRKGGKERTCDERECKIISGRVSEIVNGEHE